MRRRGRHEDEASQLRKPLLSEEEDADLGEDVWYGSARRAYEPVSTRSADAEEDDTHKTSREHAAASRWWQDNFATVLLKWITWIEMLPGAFGSFLNYIGRKLFGLFQPSSTSGQLPPPKLSPIQVERFERLRARASVPFSSTSPSHQEALQKLWRLAYPHQQLTGMVSEQWKEMGWQGTDPSTDFRGGGFISLENLLYFAEKHPRDFQRLLKKEDGERAQWEYPFAVAGLNLSFMLVDLLDLKAEDGVPRSAPGRGFLRFLEDDDSAFDALYVRAFLLLDAEWLRMRASYMEFNVVMKAVRAKLEHLLSSSRLKSMDEIVL
ncbi:ELMO/CED-12 domain-containing protein [Klebsormidium nitens]|uniref:ELMO/CED-12 domain-containing protein n=1 Tax=Klebsormidium nitens TaxID=105231 RepID=A0A1Y1HQQ4_KLENI|nr:ELMO/CED-12 domain-containing protein [Klebsormidium nitens]|eukprot:GAQ80122.1 ELMO/CED-12 domain-containing protein [Klebsormidium nitens]